MMKLSRKALALLACAMLTVTAAGCGNPAENNENAPALEAMASLQESGVETDADNAEADPTEEPSDTAAPTEEPSTPTDSPEESEVADPTRESGATEEPATIEPTKEPESTTEPATEPAATAKPTAVPADTPAPTPEPTQEPAPTAEPTPTPAAPTPEPVQEPVAPTELPAPVETPAQSASTMSEADVLAKISELQAMYPEGTAWGDNDSYDTATPVDAYITNSDACAGWVKLASDYIYGNGASATLFVATHPSQMQVGDIVLTRTHAFIFTGYEESIDNAGVTIHDLNGGSGNVSGEVHWGRTYCMLTGHGETMNVIRRQ